MRLLPRRRREAMYAIYAFCREVDDIADEGGSPAEKQQALAAWRDEIERLYAGRPRRPTTQALLPAVTAYKLPKEEFLAGIYGNRMQADVDLRAPDLAHSPPHCPAVATPAWVRSVHSFAAPDHHTDNSDR